MYPLPCAHGYHVCVSESVRWSRQVSGVCMEPSKAQDPMPAIVAVVSELLLIEVAAYMQPLRTEPKCTATAGIQSASKQFGLKQVLKVYRNRRSMQQTRVFMNNGVANVSSPLTKNPT